MPERGRRVHASAEETPTPTRPTRVTLERDAHAGAVLALATIPPDAATGRPLLVVSTSMDGTAATWTLDPSSGAMAPRERLAPADGSAPWWCVVPSGDGDAVYVGTHARDARAVDARRIVDHEHHPSDASRRKSRVSNHTGWVRAVAVLPRDDDEEDEDDEEDDRYDDRYGFSAACNVVRAWRDVGDGNLSDVQSGDVQIFTGDILALAATSGRLFCGVADGTVRGWSVRICGGGRGIESQRGPGREGAAGGPVAMSPLRRPDDQSPEQTELNPAHTRDHPGRVAALVAVGRTPRDERFVVSGCHGGMLRSWSTSDLAPRGSVQDAHGANGVKVRCLFACSIGFRSGDGGSVGDGGVGGVDFYSGGDDGWVRAWSVDGSTGTIRSVDDASFLVSKMEDGAGVDPASRRPAGVRAIAEVPGGGTLVVGDDRGVLSTWRVG